VKKSNIGFLIVYAFWFAPTALWGQHTTTSEHSVSVSFNRSFSADYFDVGYSFQKGSHTFYSRLGFLRNQTQFLPDQRYYYKSLYADSFQERFGLGLGYNRTIYSYDDIAEIGLFTEVYTWYCSQRKNLSTFVGYDSTGTFEVYESGLWFTRPNIVIQLNIGVSAKAHLSKRVYIKTAFAVCNYAYFNASTIRPESQILFARFDFGDRVQPLKAMYTVEIGYTF
jgi:hypothetical protein